MIKLFQPSDTLFSSNGDVVILPIKAKVHKEDNGDYYLDIVTGLEYAEFIAEGAILVADTPQGEQAFRVTNPQKDMHKITARAWQVFYDAENYVVTDYQFENKDLAEILAELNDHATPESPFTTFTDEPFFGTGRFTMTSLYDAVIELINSFGGHLIRDNFSFGINQSIGADNGVTVEYRKNLKELSCSEVWDNVVTKILPVGKDGIMLDAVDATESIYIDAPIQYDIPYCKIVQFEQDINQEDYETEEAYTLALVNDLRQQATAYLNINCIPQVNYTLKANLERLTDVGDIIEVRDHRLGIDILTNVIAFDYDCILGKYTEIEFGNALPKLSNLVSTITADASKGVDAKVAQATAPIQQDIKHISDKMSDGYVIYDGDKILVLDALPKTSAQNVMKITNDGISFSSTGINGTFTLAWSLTDVVNLSNIDFLGWSIRSFELSSGDDLDDITTPNFYVGDTSDGYTNCPLQSGAFLLLVAEAGKSGQLMQYIISCDQASPTIQMRFYDVTWGSWVSAGGGGASPSSTTPLMDGTASTGSESDFARGDHRHPTDTTRAPLDNPEFTTRVTSPIYRVTGHDTAIGASGGVGSNSSQVSLGTTAKAIANRTLTTGVWILIGRVQVTHGSNATYAMFNISTTSADSTVEAQYYMNSSYDLGCEVVKIVNVTASSQTFYLNGKSGRAVNVASGKGTLTAWRLI